MSCTVYGNLSNSIILWGMPPVHWGFVLYLVSSWHETINVGVGSLRANVAYSSISLHSILERVKLTPEPGKAPIT